MDREDRMRDLFNKFGFHPSSEALRSCINMCLRHEIDNLTFIDSWISFSLSELNGEPPTEEKLILFEKKVFGGSLFSTSRLDHNKISKKEIRYASPIQSPANGNKRRIDDTLSELNLPRVITMDNIDTILPESSIVIPSPRPVSPPPYDIDESGSLPSSTDLFSPCQSVKTYGYNSTNNPCNSVVKIRLYNGVIKKSWTSMIEMTVETWNLRHDFAEEIAAVILEKNKLPDPFSFYDLPVESQVYVGKVVQDVGRIYSTDLCIEGLGRQAHTSVTLDISGIENFSVFPGQIIAFKGVSSGADRLIATELYTNARGPVPKPPVVKEPFSIMIAAGPFAPVECTETKLVDDLIDHVKALEPACLILIGPFLDYHHDFYIDLNMELFSSRKFLDQHNMMLKKCSEAFAELKTKVYYVTCSTDFTSIPVFPTPIPNEETGNNSHFVLPDPSLLDINGLILGVTSADIIFFLSQQEFTNSKGGNRLARLAQHLINQQSFYPIEPGPFDELAVDYAKVCLQARLPVVPHVLVLPSELNNYIKEVEGCVIINPEKCVSGRRGNNFALIEVRGQCGSEEWNPSTHISAKIVRI